MKIYITILLFLSSMISKADYWTQKANYPGAGSRFSFCFSIGTKGYVGGGFDTTIGNWSHTDLWEFDPSINVWTQKANIGGVSRGFAVAFSVGSLAYVGTGFTQGNGQLLDFWEYNPINNIWTQKANFAGGHRENAVGFSIGNLGYVGMGQDNSGNLYNDLWQYNPANDTWVQKTSCPGSPRTRANCFVIGTEAYIIGGAWSTWNDVWQYNSITDSWIQKGNFPSSGRCWASALSICGLGYYGTGGADDWWQYEPLSDSWIQKTNFAGLPTTGTSYFSIGAKGYVGLGNYDSFYEYTPDSVCITAIEEQNKASVNIFPNPFNRNLYVRIDDDKQYEVTIYNYQSNKLVQNFFTNSITIDTEPFAKGVYLYEVRNSDGFCIFGKLVKD